MQLSSTTTLTVPARLGPLLSLGEGNAETAWSREAFIRGLHTQGIEGPAQVEEEEAEEKGGKSSGKRKKERATGLSHHWPAPGV